MQTIDPQKLDRVIRHYNGTLGLRFRANISGNEISEYVLRGAEFVGVGEDTSRGVMFGVIVSGIKIQFEIARAKLKLFAEWLEQAFASLTSGGSEKYASLPPEFPVIGGVCESFSGLKSYAIA